MSKIPNKLVASDEIRIISTARSIDKKELEKSIGILKSWGLKVSLGSNIFKVDRQFAGSVGERVDDLQEAIDDPQVKAILFARGGYGTVQIIDKIDFSSLRYNHKWLLGYSDITVIHSHIHNLSIASIHSTMPISFSNNTEEAINSLKTCLMSEDNTLECAANINNKLGMASGEIVGGNLSILYSLIGSPSDIDTRDKILFIEDVGEYLYHIDRMMMNMKRSAKFDGIKALIVGSFTDMEDNTIPFGKNVYEIITGVLSECDFPIAFDFPAGHLSDNRAMYLGVDSELIIEEDRVVLTQNIYHDS